MKKLVLLGALLVSVLTYGETTEKVVIENGKIYKMECEVINKKEIPFEEIRTEYIEKIDKEIDKIVNEEMDMIVQMLRIYQLVNMKKIANNLEEPNENILRLLNDNL